MENDIKKSGTLTGRITGNEPNSKSVSYPVNCSKHSITEDEFEKLLNDTNGGGDPGFGTWVRKDDPFEFKKRLDQYNRGELGIRLMKDEDRRITNGS
jgi:hypothetical protein